MLILLPPSEGKAVPRRGRPIDLAKLSLPELNPARERTLAALVDLCSSADAERARQALGLSAGQHEDVVRNAALWSAPTAPARSVYTGVLYQALDFNALSPPAKRLATRSLLIFSGLWGVLRTTDRIPSYRCSIGVRLPGPGALGAYWRKALTQPITDLAGRGVVLDLRSSGYLGAWTPPAPVAGRTVTVRVVQERLVGGAPTRIVVSHFNKATKGRLVRDLLEAGASPRTPAALVRTLKELGYQVELTTPLALDVVVSDV
ncbi:MAG TPA: peroxide stress protein YaaA [Micromonosporaceae bacterium]